jgi:hypothetical protein
MFLRLSYGWMKRFDLVWSTDYVDYTKGYWKRNCSKLIEISVCYYVRSGVTQGAELALFFSVAPGAL